MAARNPDPSRSVLNPQRWRGRDLQRAAWLLLGLLAVGCASSTAEPRRATAPARRTAPSLGATDPAVTRPAGTIASPPEPQATLLPIPTVSLDEHRLGPPSAPVTLIVYSDFQCVSCAQLASVLRQLRSRHPHELQLIFRHFPLLHQHDKASLAGQLTELAAEQGAFWTVHDRLFERWPEWTALAPEDFPAWAVQQALALDLDAEAIRSGLAEGRYQNRLLAAYEQGLAMGLPSSPFLLLDGRPFVLPPELNYLEAAVRLQALAARQFQNYPEFTVDPDLEYLARLRLAGGVVVIQLYPQIAPLAVNSFVFLADRGWFDGNALYHVQPGVFVESGDPTGTGLGDPGYLFPMETDPTLRFDQPGMVALVPIGPDSNGGRFFISLAPLPELDGARTIFGRVVQGLEHLRDLPARDPLQDLLTPAQEVLLGVVIEARR